MTHPHRQPPEQPARPARQWRGGHDWAEYWRAPDRPVEAMRAHFVRHVFHRHSHDAYSFAVTESGAQRFACRGATHTSSAGMVMAFNPEDPHDGRTATEPGFTYRIVHLAPEVVRDTLSDVAGAPAPLPLFDAPVRDDPVSRAALLRLHRALAGNAGRLVRDERLTAALASLAGRLAARPPRAARAAGSAAGARAAAARARALLEDAWAEDVGADRLAAEAGCSRFALYRAFTRTYGMPPSDFQRQLRLRAARRALAGGATAAEAAATCGFTDQSHLHRWFVRAYGVTPGDYARATSNSK